MADEQKLLIDHCCFLIIVVDVEVDSIVLWGELRIFWGRKQGEQLFR